MLEIDNINMNIKLCWHPVKDEKEKQKVDAE